MTTSGPSPRRTDAACPGRLAALGAAVAVMVGRFLLMWAVVAAAAGLGWYAGLLANAVLAAAGALLVARLGLWGRLGPLVPPGRVRRAAAIPLALLTVEAVLWAVPEGIASRPPGLLMWALTLALVGVNEELFTRGVVLSLLERAFSPAAAAVLSGVVFGLQHVSALVLTQRDVVDVGQNVLLSGVVGVAYAAFQLRFRWIWPLIVVHALADFMTVLAVRSLPDWIVVADHLLLALFAAVLLRGLGRTDDE